MQRGPACGILVIQLRALLQKQLDHVCLPGCSSTDKRCVPVCLGCALVEQQVRHVGMAACRSERERGLSLRASPVYLPGLRSLRQQVDNIVTAMAGREHQRGKTRGGVGRPRVEIAAGQQALDRIGVAVARGGVEMRARRIGGRLHLWRLGSGV